MAKLNPRWMLSSGSGAEAPPASIEERTPRERSHSLCWRFVTARAHNRVGDVIWLCSRPCLKAASAVLVLLLSTMAAGQTVLECGLGAAGTLKASGQQDVYTFTAAAGDSVVIRLTRTSGDAWPRMELQGPDLLRIASASNGVIDAAGLKVGLHHVVVSADSLTQPTAYALYFQRPNSPCGAVELLPGRPTPLAITSPGQILAYTFAAAAGERINIHLPYTSTNWTPYFELISPDGNVMGGWEGYVRQTLARSGVYTVLVRDRYSALSGTNPGGNRTGTATLTYQRLNNPANAVALTPGIAVDVPMTVAGADLYYTFQAGAGDKIAIRLTRTSGLWSPYFGVDDPVGDWVDGSFDGSMDRVLTRNGTYLITVINWYNSAYGGIPNARGTGTATLVFQRLNRPENTTALPCGRWATGNIAAAGQIKYYIFSGSAGDSITVRTTGVSPALLPRLDLYSPLGSTGATARGGPLRATLGQTGAYLLTFRDDYVVAPPDGPTGGQGVGNYALMWDSTVRSCLSLPPGSVALTGILPDHGGDSGMTTVLVYGAGFQSDARAVLSRTGQPDIISESASPEENGTILNVRFDLRDKAHGQWDLTVVNPGGGAGTLRSAFLIDAASTPPIAVEIIGPSVMRVNRPQTYVFQYTNTGNLDAEGVILNIDLPKGSDYTTRTELLPTSSPWPSGEPAPSFPMLSRSATTRAFRFWFRTSRQASRGSSSLTSPCRPPVRRNWAPRPCLR